MSQPNPKSQSKKKAANQKEPAEVDPSLCKKCGEVHPRCTGHRKRKNTNGKWVKCMQWPVKGSRTRKCMRCGGLTPKGAASPHFVDGKRSKYQYAPEHTAKRVEELAGDAIKNLEENVNLQRALESQYLEKLDTGESPEAWQTIKRILDKVDLFDLSKLIAAVVIIKAIVDGAIAQDSLKAKIVSYHESQRKLTETLTKCRKDMQETFTMAQWDELLILVLSIIRNNVDRATLTRIQNAFIAAGGGANGDQSGAPKLIEAG